MYKKFKFSRRDNLELFSLCLIQNKFFYRFNCKCFLSSANSKFFSKPIYSKISIPFSYKFSNKKSIKPYWEFIRTCFYGLSLYGAKPSKVFIFKTYYTFFFNIPYSTQGRHIVSFFKKFRRKNSKLFFKYYFTKNHEQFRFFLRDTHIFSHIFSKTFDYYNWQNRVQYNFYWSLSFKKYCRSFFIYPELTLDFKLLIFTYLFSFSNKKISNALFVGSFYLSTSLLF